MASKVNSRGACAFVLVVIFAESIYAAEVGVGGFGGLDMDNARSTMLTIQKTCHLPGITNEVVAKRFLDCYDEAPGKKHFFSCQENVFGRLFDTVSNIKVNCAADPSINPLYLGCIKTKIDKDGLDLNEAVRKLTACQLAIFNYEEYEHDTTTTFDIMNH